MIISVPRCLLERSAHINEIFGLSGSPGTHGIPDLSLYGNVKRRCRWVPLVHFRHNFDKQFRQTAGTTRHIQTFRRCVDEFLRISVKYVKSEVRSWDSDVRRKIGQKYHSCGAKVTCAASKVTCAAQISSVRQHFYHWNFSKCNMYMRIINVQTGTHTPIGFLLLKVKMCTNSSLFFYGAHRHTA